MGKRGSANGDAGQGGAFAELLRGMRERAGLTQEELAVRAGLSPNAVGALERGVRRRPYPHTVRSLADALGLAEAERASLLAAVPGRGGSRSGAADAPTRAALPYPVTPVLGRERELDEVVGLLTRPEVRILTLTGIGGVGKTRLALEVAREGAGLFLDGVAFVGLAPLQDHSLVATEILRSLGFREAEGRTAIETLWDQLREQRLLLVLDNFEHLLEASAEVSCLVEACPGIVVLATSRAPLRVRGEQEYPVPPLALPSSTRNLAGDDTLEAPSGRLFLERARAVSPGFHISENNAGAVAAICWRLAGLPLALELAAAKTRFMDPAALLPRLDRALSTASARDLPERQRTMRSTLDWSHDLLTEKEGSLFLQLAVFSGGFTLEAAEEVCAFGEVEPGEVLELLGRITEQSLVTATPGVDVLRYGMLEPVRQYALERLTESDEEGRVRGRHAEYFATLAEDAKPVFLGPEHPVWSDRLELEHDNLREALRWSRETGDVRTGLRLVGALSLFWWMRGYLHEGRRWAKEFLSKPFDIDRPGCGPARAGAVYGAGELALGQGDLVRAYEHFEEALALFREIGDEAGAAAVLAELGQVSRAQGDYERAAALSEESLDLGRRLGELKVVAIALNTLGHVERQRGNMEGAVSRQEESLALFRKIGHGWGSAYTLTNLAVAALGRRDLKRALALGEEGLSIYRELGDRSGMALALISLGDVARERGEDERAYALYDDALALYRELGNERGAARALARLEDSG
jgi:predicted ATPase/DNA-binding XRE family transcriptional regulator